ncbi:hypothetical protein ECC02_012697 [Trypanosoma cruzi]|uniref:Uncharacterized protein n=1 Tax=Trypanosoma cruzi TaxID=5693 RepID=A0A7J6XJS7_TRYCR|nr:hypothetical protein ECC02_012697 [Trypanosoma cruzi]
MAAQISLPSGIGCAAVQLGPRLCCASARTSSRREHRHSLPSSKRLMDALLPTPRQTDTRPADYRQPFIFRWCRPSHTEETGPPRPPPEPPPGVSTAPPRRMKSSRSTSPCPIGSSVFSSVHNMKVHARRTNPGTPIAGEGIACGFCNSSTVFPRSASRAVRYRKCQAYQRAKNGRRTSASSNDSRSPSATPPLQPPPAAEPPDGPREALPHTLWECPRPLQLSIRLFGNTTSRTTASFKKEKLATYLRTVLRPLTNSGSKV